MARVTTRATPPFLESDIFHEIRHYSRCDRQMSSMWGERLMVARLRETFVKVGKLG